MSRRTFGYIRKLPSGNLQASYVGPDGIRYNANRTFRNRTDANAWLARIQTSIEKGRWLENPTVSADSDVTFGSYALRHIEIQTNFEGATLRESTKALYRRLLRTKLSGFLNLKVSEIDAAMISNWWAKSIETGTKTSSSKAYKLLNAVLNRAVGEKLIPSNVCQVKGAQNATTGKTIKVPDLEQVSLIAKHINPRYTEFVVLAAHSGLRFGEMTELRGKDFVEVERLGQAAFEIRVSRAVTLVPGGHKIDRPKSKAGIRTVPIGIRLTPLVRSLLDQLDGDMNALVFPSASGGHLRHDVFTNSWRRALARAGLQESGFTPHSLRHYYGTFLSLAGANIPELKAALGDSSTSVVMRYVHDTNRSEELADRLTVKLVLDDIFAA